MLQVIGAAAVLALTAAHPAFAQGHGPGNNSGRGSGNTKTYAGDAQGKGNLKANRGDENAKRGGPDQAAKRDRPAQAARTEPSDRRFEQAVRERHQRPALVERTAVRERDGRYSDGNDGWHRRDRSYASVPGCPPGLAKKNNGCLPPGVANGRHDDRYFRNRYFSEYRPDLFGVPIRTRARYVYYDGYLIPDSSSGLGFIPLLGGALAVGQVWPEAYPSLPISDWRREYYGFQNERDYRYADNVIYRVDPETAAIQSVVALVTGDDFSIGSQMPQGYDVYNVPAPYSETYYDTDDALYRYADARIYEVDPTTSVIAKAIDLVL